ncbi:MULTISPECIES: VOC family protein [unclassified Desulfovibrio]|uniref:VOC family protein n=1 Tax=unclassified Desulfovibrio TaxID=2593640 RepID=UPI002FD88877
MNRINVICLGVRDIVKARAFYRDGLGFTTPNNEEKPDVVFFSNGGTKLELYPLAELAKDINETNPPALGTGFGGITLAFNAKTKEEVDAIFAKVESLGGTIAKRPETAFWGGYSGYIQDLDGYYWEIAYWDGWRFDANDMLIIDEHLMDE